jgi:ABC-type nitrate/sulfonate/bicarbonate transport system ATPase subunit
MIMVTHDVAEAVHLASRVIVMAANPGRITDIVTVPNAYPREQSAATLRPLEEAILAMIMRETPAAGHLPTLAMSN